MLPGAHYWLAGAGEEEGRYRAQAERIGSPTASIFPDRWPMPTSPNSIVQPTSWSCPRQAGARQCVGRGACLRHAHRHQRRRRRRRTRHVTACRRIVERTPEAIAAAVRAILANPPSQGDVAASLDGGSIGTETAASLRTISTAALAGRRTDSGVSRKSYTTAPSSLRSMRSARRKLHWCAAQSCQGQPSAIRGSAPTYRSTNRCR
jgi:hypothetical protein